MSTQHNTAPPPTGLVISYFGNSVAVLSDTGQVFQCHLRRNQELPVVGDQVHWQQEADQTGIILDVLPRRSVLVRGDTRGDGRGRQKPIAANIDVMLIVMAPPPVFSEYLLDRYLVAAELLSIKPIIVLNKIDLIDVATLEQRLAVYQRIPYTVVLTSTYSGAGLVALAALLKNQSAVLVGPSGVGKSSIITALTEGETIRVAAVSPRGAGKHTTTATRLYLLPHGGNLIDSPGVREFNLWAVSKQSVLRGFKEFAPYLSGCRFRDCQHVIEPDCKVRDAVASGKINAERYASYQTLMKQAEAS